MERTGVLLDPEFYPKGVVKSPSVAKQLVQEAELTVPTVEEPKCDLEKWEYVIDMLHPTAIYELGESLDSKELADCFKALSIRFDEGDFTVSDIVSIESGPDLSKQDSEEIDEYIQHVESSYTYALSVLPPVTTALLGSWLDTVSVFDYDYYVDVYLPEGKRWGGMHFPDKREIQVTTKCYVDDPSEVEYPLSHSYGSCTLLHELAHAVHYLYGFQRPNDDGFEYPSSKNELESTGCVSPIELMPEQAEFVLEMFKAYVFHHQPEYEKVRANRYCQTHPVEAFACAFEVLLRYGTEPIATRYPQFYDVLSLMK